MIWQGGGDICASLDVAGAGFSIEECLEECTAFAGTLSGAPIDCLESVVTLSAEANGDSNVPVGYSVVYVLTQGEGLVVVNAGPEPSFEVEEEGLFTIHTLVYDANTLDLGIVEFGVTTGFDVNGLLIQGGGELCASLDVAGAAFLVGSCSAPCLANAGTLTADALEVCLENGMATISATPNGDSFVPADFFVGYVLTRTPDLIIEQIGLEPTFMVTGEDIWTIHTLVLDTTQLDLATLTSVIEFGTTSGLAALEVLNGTGVCFSLDVVGAKVTTEECESAVNGSDEVSLTAWPSPTNQFLNVEARIVRGDRAELTILSMQGTVVIPTTVMPGGQRMVIDVQNLRAGQYMIRLVSGDKAVTERFLRMD